MKFFLKQPSAWIPIALSLTVLVIMLLSIMISGVPALEADEGTAAHLFQIWLVIEVLSIAFFAIKWLPRNPKQAFQILVFQGIAMLAAFAPVFYFEL